jgi:ATP/maltotriose-dependent transcriptional regulator MalT/DNA-binding SARP family transcriptional activator
VDLLLRYAPAHLHFVITSRNMPRLRQISRLRNQGEAILLNGDDLTFTNREIQALYALHADGPLSSTVANQLKEHTFGWPLSIQLTLKSLGQQPAVANAEAISQQLTDYFRDDVLAQHPERVQNFIKDIAIFDTVLPAVAEEVLGHPDTPALIDYLKQHNLFLVSLKDEPEAYHYPPQVRSLLQSSLIIESRARYLELHRRAARYFEARGQLHQALDHYQQAEDWDATIDLLEGLTEAMLNGQHLEKVRRWLQCLSPKSQIANPKFLLYQAQLQARIGQPAESLTLLSEARRIFSQGHQPRYEVVMLAQMGLIHVQEGDYPTARHLLQQIYQISPSDIPLSPDLDLLSSLLMAVAEDLPRAIKTSQKALYHYEIQADLYGQAQAMIHLAGFAIDIGRMTKANTLLAQSAELIEQLNRPAYLDILHATVAARCFWLSGNLAAAAKILAARESIIEDQTVASLFAIRFREIQGTISGDQGLWAKAESEFDQALDAAERQAWALKAGIIEGLAWLRFRQNDLEAAWQLAHQAKTLVIAENMRQEGQIRLLLGALARAKGSYQDALLHLEAAQEIFRAQEFNIALWSTRLHLSQTYFDLGYTEQALTCLGQALTFGRSHDINRAYCWHPELAARLCLLAIEKEIEGQYATYLATKLIDHLRLADILTLKDINNPQVCLPFLHLLKEIGTDEAQQQLRLVATTTPVSQIKAQAEKVMGQLGQVAAAQAGPRIHIYALGNLRVERNGQPIEGAAWAGKSKAGRQKVKTLLAYLVERGRQGATKDELVEALWRSKAWGRDEARLESSLARTLSALRHVLEPELTPPVSSSFILNEEGRYYLNEALCWIDVEEFQELIREARGAKLQGEAESAQRAYQKAITLYRAEYLRDILGAEEWAGIQRYVLSQQLGVAFMNMGGYYLETENTKEAAACFLEAIKQEPTNHTAHYMLIDVLRQEGRFDEAILAYQRCRKMFNQEIDEEPPEAIIELYESIYIQAANQKRTNQPNQPVTLSTP